MKSNRLVRGALVAAAGLAFALPAGAVVSAPPQPQILVLSNRADLVSGGNALVEILWPAGANVALAKIALDGVNVKPAFAQRPNGRYMGVVSGLKNGNNVLTARVPGAGAQITIKNHPIGGPVFSGEQMLPWICARMVATMVNVTVPGTGLSANATTRVSGLASDPIDAQCNAATRYTHYYKPSVGKNANCSFTFGATTVDPNRCFDPYPVDATNPANRPANALIADFTNDRGDTAKALIRVERGAMNRGIYELVTYYDPAVASAPWAPQKGWNGKLLWRFGAASGYSRFQEPTTTSVSNNNALSRGFMVASSSLTDHNSNANDTLGAEMVMMVKERIAETYGPIRFTVGDGGSGGAIYQHQVAAAYPGLLQGLQPGISFPDTWTTGIEVGECGLLQNQYYATRTLIELPSAVRAAINGHLSTNFCAAWISSFLPRGNPAIAGNCGTGFPTALTYNAATRPDGVRCTGADHSRALLGTIVDTDGITKSPSPFDNEGLQYGLKALQSGVLSAEEFVRVNEGVGSYTLDQGWIPPARKVAHTETLRTVYTSGIVSDGRQLAKVAIIDLRSNQGSADIHMNWRSWALRDRLDKANGHHDNQVIWASQGTGAALTLRSFVTLDAWLTAVENDPSAAPLEQKIVINKPAEAVDLCLTTSGATDAQIATTNVGLGTAACPTKFQESPRRVAGGPLSEDVWKCQLKPFNPASADYAGVAFTPDQQARLAAVFPTGVCDWSLPGVEQAPANPWTTFSAGPGGQPLGPVPASVPIP